MELLTEQAKRMMILCVLQAVVVDYANIRTIAERDREKNERAAKSLQKSTSIYVVSDRDTTTSKRPPRGLGALLLIARARRTSQAILRAALTSFSHEKIASKS